MNYLVHQQPERENGPLDLAICDLDYALSRAIASHAGLQLRLIAIGHGSVRVMTWRATL